MKTALGIAGAALMVTGAGLIYLPAAPLLAGFFLLIAAREAK